MEYVPVHLETLRSLHRRFSLIRHAIKVDEPVSRDDYVAIGNWCYDGMKLIRMALGAEMCKDAENTTGGNGDA